MPSLHETPPLSNVPPALRWSALAEGVLAGHRLDEEDGLAILQSPNAELLDVLAAAYRVRHRWFGNEVRLNFLINAKSGLCSEDCGYCSQSRISRAEIPRYNLLDPQQILAGAAEAAQRQAKTYCIVISGRSPDDRELDAICQLVPQIKSRHAMKICVSPGLLTPEQAARLKACGVDRVNHNLNTSQRFYATICTTHSYQDRLATLRAVRQAEMEICCGGIVGMGEEDADVVELALRLGELRAEAVPVNFLQPIAGTPVGERVVGRPFQADGDGPQMVRGGQSHFRSGENRDSPRPGLTPQYCLKVLALFRLANPRCELRIAAGREMHLRSLQPLGLYAANSMFVGDYLTTKGQPPAEDYRMIADLGFAPVIDGG